MSVTRINSVSLKSFRGVRLKKSLVLDGKSLLLFGENGTGKSSFVEGIELVLTGGISTLDGRGQNISSERHAAHVLGDQTDAVIELTTGDRLGLSSTRNPLTPPARAFATAARVPDHYILRRSKVLRFVEAVPKDRYETLRPFLPLDEISGLEATFNQSLQQLEAVSSKADTRFREAKDRLLRLPGISIAPATNLDPAVLSGVNQALAALGLAQIGDLTTISSAITAIDQALEIGQEALAVLPKPQAAPPDLSAFAALGALTALNGQALLESLQHEESTLVLLIDDASKGIREALSDIAAWIDTNSPETCPVCEQQIEPETIATRIRVRLKSVQQVLDAQRTRKERLKQLKTSLQEVRNAVVRALVRPLGITDDWWNPREAQLQGTLSSIDDLALALNETTADAFAPLSQKLSDLRALLEAISKAATIGPAQANASQDAEALRKTQVSLIELRGSLGQLTQLLSDLSATQAAFTRSKRSLDTAKIVLKHLQDARKTAVQGIYSDLANDIDDMYGRLHPNEPIGSISLDIKATGQGSAYLRGRFHNRDGEDPRGYFSEAHLDTLGVCIFLALRKRLRSSDPAFDLLVLDDVLTSVDAAHASRIADLLLTDFRDYQVILTTHSRIWHEHLRGLIARKGLDQSYRAVTIHRWTLEDGPDIREIAEERDELIESIANGSLSSVASGAGILLDQLLVEMRYELGLAVSAQRGERYTLMDIWPAFRKRVKKDFPALEASCTAILADIERLLFTRNWAGAHYNEWAKELSMQDARELAGAVLKLYDALHCDSCRRFVTQSKSPVGQLACKCGKLVHYQQKTA